MYSAGSNPTSDQNFCLFINLASNCAIASLVFVNNFENYKQNLWQNFWSPTGIEPVLIQNLIFKKFAPAPCGRKIPLITKN
jgi:hypothetical protein